MCRMTRHLHVVISRNGNSSHFNISVSGSIAINNGAPSLMCKIVYSTNTQNASNTRVQRLSVICPAYPL